MLCFICRYVFLCKLLRVHTLVLYADVHAADQESRWCSTQSLCISRLQALPSTSSGRGPSGRSPANAMSSFCQLALDFLRTTANIAGTNYDASVHDTSNLVKCS